MYSGIVVQLFMAHATTYFWIQ